MPSIKEVVNRIHSINATQKITKAMKMVAAAKLTQAQHQLVQVRAYEGKLRHILANITDNMQEPLAHPYLQQRAIEKVLLIVISADKGLCGSFNTNVLKRTVAHIHAWTDIQATQVDLLIIGKKAFNFFQKKSYRLITNYSHLSNNYLKFLPASQVADFIIQAFVDRTYDRVELIYNHFFNAAHQVVQIEQLLPMLQSRLPADYQAINYIYEPSKPQLVDVLCYKLLKIQFYRALLEAQGSEHGARMTAMTKATDNAEEILQALRISYNRSRQASITEEILEIIAGTEALKTS
jgi:F-type H+-transporting ATPase subunit gamma